MFNNVMIFLLVATGVFSIIVSVQEYLKIKKDTQYNSETQLQKSQKTEAIIYIILNVLYVMVGVSLVLEVISIQYAFIYMIISKVVEKIVQYMMKKARN